MSVATDFNKIAKATSKNPYWKDSKRIGRPTTYELRFGKGNDFCRRADRAV